jgi:UDP-glucuronate 4-epimerase
LAILVTGAAGFIGFHLAARLLARGDSVVGIDDLNDYYSVKLKKDRLAVLSSRFADKFIFHQVDFSDSSALQGALQPHKIARIAHLGAQPGVRYSLINPHSYVRSNVVGHLNLLEFFRHSKTCDHMVYASSSSVYGSNEKLPFAVDDRADHPVSLYGATKKADELLSDCYSHLYRLPQTGLRFFTVYGPWGRPDMAVWIFTKAILAGEPIPVFNNGDLRRDFTYIDDIVSGVTAALDNPPSDDNKEKPGGSHAPHRIYNIGNHRSEPVMRMIAVLEQALGKPAIKDFQPMRPGDVKETFADIAAIQNDLGFKPSTSIEIGLPKFVSWYRDYQRG